MKIGVALKIGGVVILLLVLVGSVSWVNARSARRVQSLIEDVHEIYVPAYGALARTNLRLMEEGLFERRLLLARQMAPDDLASVTAFRQSIAEKSQQTDSELHDARRLVTAAINDPAVFADDLDLARLDTRLDFLQRRHLEYDTIVAALEKASDNHDQVELDHQLRNLDQQRDALNDEAEIARSEMRDILDHAGKMAIHAQDVSVKIGLALLALALALGTVTAAIIILGLVRPLRRLLQGTLLVQAGHLDTEVPVTSRDEVGELTIGFNNMVRDLRAKARIRETFGRYIDPRIVEGLIDQPDRLGGTGERREMTVFFSDMQGFTSLSEGMTPVAMVRVVNRYLALMSEPVRFNHGIIDKYIGDAIMAFWGPPFSRPEDQARLACVSALDQLAALQVFRGELPDLTGFRRGGPQVDMRIGIATGEVVVGNIGSDLTMNYTVMGDTVNLASRLERANKIYGTHLMVSARTVAMAGETLAFREIDWLRVGGKQEPERVFEILGRRGEVPAEVLAMARHFAEGLAAYRQRDWAAATAAFGKALEVLPDDGPSQTFLRRIDQLGNTAPGAGWDGVWTLNEK